MTEFELENGYKIVKKEYDRKLLIAVIMLIVIGCMAIMSASLPLCITHDKFLLYYVIQHFCWVVLGGFGLVWFSKFDYRNLKRVAFPFCIGVILLLLIVKFTPLGVTINGAKRWLNLGLFQFQPSELSKLALVMLLANLFSLKKEVLFTQIHKYLLALGSMMFIVLKQPNLSMTIILLGITFFMYVFSGKSLKPIFVGIAVLICLMGMAKMKVIDLYKYLEPHQIERLENFRPSYIDVQGGGYQVFHSKIAIASGGILGCGYGGSKEKLGWLPEPHTDFIFSVIGEEFGFAGCFFIIALFLFLFQRGVNIAIYHPNLYGKLLAFGITISITMQAFFNMSVATAFLPATGITLPFISYGGSSLFVTMCMIGILLNISMLKLVRVEKARV